MTLTRSRSNLRRGRLQACDREERTIKGVRLAVDGREPQGEVARGSAIGPATPRPWLGATLPRDSSTMRQPPRGCEPDAASGTTLRFQAALRQRPWSPSPGSVRLPNITLSDRDARILPFVRRLVLSVPDAMAVR